MKTQSAERVHCFKKTTKDRLIIVFLMLFSGILNVISQTGVAQAQVPSAPTNLVITPINTGGMIQFTAPSSIGDSAITNYEYSSDGGDNWIASSPAITESPLIISSGLTNCTAYSIKIRAVNGSGSGAASVSENLIPTESSDIIGTNWMQRTSAADNIWNSVTYGNGLFVAVASSGTGNRVMTSPNGVTWTARASSVGNSWRSVAYGNGLFVAVASTGTGNRVMTSPDGITWTTRTSAANNSWTSVTYGNNLFVAVANSGSFNRVMTSPDGITWTIITSIVDNGWSGVTYGNGLFVAASVYNKFMTSPDGINWTLRTTAAINNWTSITYGNNLFVAVANSGVGNRVMTSPDGITWTSRTSAADNSWYSVTYGNNLFVAVASTGTGNRVMTSSNGINWTARTSAADNSWYGVCYGNGIFVAVASSGTGNRVMTSSFSVAAAAPVISNIYPRNNAASIAFTQTGSAFAPAVSNYEYSIDNGTTWTARNPASYLSPMIISGLNNGTNYDIKIRAINSVGTSCTSNMISVTPALGSVADAPTNLVVTPINTGGMIQFSSPANDGGSAITNYEYSTDGGSNWITPSPAIIESPLIISSGLNNCTTYSIKLRAVNTSGSGSSSVAVNLMPVASINQGIKWTSRTSAADNNWTSVTYGNGLFVAVAYSGTGNRVMTSPDGITWTSRTSAADNYWNGITYGNGLFVAVAYTGTGNRVMTSPDGINWTSRITAADNNWISVTYGNNLFVAVANTGTSNRVMTSPDGINWTIRTSAADNEWQRITYGNGLFVAVARSGTSNRVMTSPDGINWTARISAADNNWYGVTYGNGLFVAVATNGTANRVMTSPDGITWTGRNAAEDNVWENVTYGNGLFVAVATTGTTGTGNRVMTSSDGINWSIRTSAADNGWYGITYGNGLFVAVSYTGTGNRVMTSGFSVAANAPVITSATLDSSTTVNFIQSSAALATSITNYEYSTDNGSNWTAVSPAATTSPLTITGLAIVPSSILIRAVNSVGNSCASNKYLACTTSSTETISACYSYTWHGTTYTASNNTAAWTGTNAAGCDSVVILNLTIITPPAQPTLACYETASFDTTTCAWLVTGSQPAMPTLACYQTASFNTTTCAWVVTGSQAAAIVTTTSVCSSYTWPTNGQPYTQSGTYNYNSNCQDYTLNLTVANVSISSLTPSSSIVGSTVVISGSGFTGATGVSFNGTSATSFTVNSNSQITATVPTGATTGTISVTVNGVCTTVSSTPFTVNASTITLNLNVFVEGFYLGNGLMQAVLFDQNEVTDSTACDYITVELRESLNPLNPVVSSITTILHTDGTAQITLPSTINGGDYYIVIKNRNSTETWSKVPVTLTSITTFDFTH
jgi:hypothetical protein